MRGLGAMRGAVALLAAVLLAAACGGDDSSGLATLAGTVTTAPAIDPEEVEPVSEPTAATQVVTETTEPIERVSSTEVDPAGADTDGTTGAATTSVPESLAEEEPPEIEDAADEDSGELQDTTGMTDEERLLAFAECMRENGVDFPDPVVEADGTVTFGFRPGGGGDGIQRLREIGRDPDLPAARDACAGMLEGLAFGPGQGGFDSVELQDSLLEFAQCMRDNGVDIGDPDMSAFRPGANDDDQPAGPFGPIDINDPDVAPAFEACQQRLPQPGRGFGGGS